MGILNELVDIGRRIHEDKLVIGSGGNISARDNGIVYIKKKGADMSRQDHNDFASVSMEGPVDITEDLSSEAPFHIACYKADNKVNAIIHVHSPYMIAAAEQALALKKVSYEFDLIIGESVPVIGFIEPGSEKLAGEISELVKNGKNTILMKKHGAISTGKDLKEAYLRIQALERACITVLHSRGA